MNQDPFRFFRVEAAELSEELSRGVLALESGSPSEIVPRLLRAAHTLKGAARVVKHRALAERAHAFEEVLQPIRERPEPPSREVIDTMLAIVDAIATLARELTPAAVAPSPAEVEALPDELPPSPTEATDLDALVEGISEVSVQLRSVRSAAGALERMHHLAALLSDQLGRATPSDGGARGSALSKARSLAAELEDFSERAERAVAGGLDQTERELSTVRVSAERLKLVPARVLQNALERTARDVARDLGKRVVFSFVGGDVRLEAHMLSQVRGALVQTVRNAVAHGIELPSERGARGKAQQGTVEVRVARQGGKVVFECRDDGRGLDLEAIRRAAERAGAVPRAGIVETSALVDILLKGGISTAKAVTETAGRGIGLDVVRDAAVRLRGQVTVDSRPGGGLTLSLIVPLALSSLDVLLVDSGGTIAAIPLEAVVAALRLTPSDVVRTAQGDSILYEGKLFPFYPLERPLSRKHVALDPKAAIPAVIVKGVSGTAAFGVDRLLGTKSIVVRGLPALAPTDAVVLGASLDVDGLPQLVVDPDALVSASLGVHSAVPERKGEPSLPVLVVDDSLTTRMLERSILESAGYEVELAASAEEALLKVEQRRYGLFLVDVEMPGMSGFDFVAKTRSHAVPAILVSSRNAPEDFDRGREVGASAYVVKAEFDQRTLLDTIRGLVAG